MSCAPAGASTGVHRATPTTTTGRRNSAAASPALDSSGRAAAHDADHEAGDAGNHRDPHELAGRALVQRVVEVAREDDLEHDARDESERRQERPDQAREHAEAPGERERERQEARGPPRLRDRDEVGKRREEQRHEHHGEDGQRPAGDVGGPSPPGGEGREREEQDSGHRNRPAPREHVRRQAVARVGADVQLPGIVLERPPHLPCIRRHRRRVVHDRDQPEHEERRRNDKRGERERPGAEVASRPEQPHEQEADERQPEEDRVGRVDDREHEAGSGGRRQKRWRRPAERLEREGERSRDEELPRGRGRKREQRVRAAVTRREADDPGLRPRDGAGRPRPPEERPAGLVRDDEREHGEDRREVDDDLLRIGARDLRDERQEPVPERERVSRVEAPVRELRHAVERQVVELEELAGAGEVEEAVALDVPRNAPEEDPQHDPCCVDPCDPGNARRGERRSCDDEHAGRDAREGEQHDGRRQRALQHERERERPEDQRQRPGERRRGAPDPERAGQQPARRQHDGGAPGEAQVQGDGRHRVSSSATSPDASHSAASRYVLPRSPRKSRPRIRSARSRSFRARSA